MKIIAAIIIVVFAVAFLYVLRRIIINRDLEDDDSEESPNLLSAVVDRCQERFVGNRQRRVARGTVLMTRYTILVYGGDGKTVIAKCPLPDEVDEFTIGRSRDNDVCINDARVTECHAKIGSDREGLFYRDNHSTNGTRKSPHSAKITGDIDITDGLVLYLGPRKIAFVNSEHAVNDNSDQERFRRLSSPKEKKEESYEGGTRVRV